MTHTPTTACICIVDNPRFQGVSGQEDENFITMDVNATFNGFSGNAGQSVTFGIAATNLQKQAAVRAVVNQLVKEVEPSITLGNSAIQIIGLPV